MSSDLFAAFGEAPASASPSTGVVNDSHDPWDFAAAARHPSQIQVGSSQATSGAPLSQNNVADDDDFGDFEDASAATAIADLTRNSANGASHKTPGPRSGAADSTLFPPKPQVREAEPEQVIGQHPFAKHMHFLFSGGDDEYDAGDDDLEDLSKNPEAAMAYSKRMIAEQEAQAKKKPLPFSKPQGPAPLPPKASNKLQKKSGYVPAKDPNVLFDADNVSEHDTDDDFGDFEAAPVITSQPAPAPPKKATPAKLQKKCGPSLVPEAQPTTPASVSKPRIPQIDLLGLGDAVSVPSIVSPRSERVNELLGHAKADSMSRPKGSSLLPKPEEDVWDDFDPAEPVSAPSLVPSHSSISTAAVSSPPATRIASIHSATRSSAQQSERPPTNIPPPLILLSRFTAIFSSAQEALFHPLSKLESTPRSQLLAHPATRQFLITYLKSATVLAHIIAGRKLRWKRDQILASSMRMGPSTAGGGKGGMKLTSIDKSEVGKEDREVLDIVQRWKGQVGKLRSAVTSAPTKVGNVPDVAEMMPVRTLKATEGGFTAPHACALCGLKREERALKVDVDVNDSFGEWWVERMNMHLVCKEWWDENKGKLKGR